MGSRITRRAALSAVVLASSGCGFKPVNFGPESSTPTQTVTTDSAKVVSAEFFLRSREGSAKRLPEGKSVGQKISTPHLDCTLRESFIGERLGQETLAQVGQESALKTPADYELMAFTLEGGLPGFLVTATTKLSSRLVIGNKPVSVPNLFGSFNKVTNRYLTQWEMFVFAVPKGAPVWLEITDEGLTIGIDLRAGVPRIDDAWKANTGFRERWQISCSPENGVFSRQFTTIPPASLKPDTGTLQLGLAPDVGGGLLPWIPTLGWAPIGKQWLAVPMRVKVAVQSKVFPKLILDVPASFEYQDETGAKYRATAPKSVDTQAISRGQADLIVIWGVRGGDKSAVISFNAVGKIEVEYTNSPPVPAQFTSEALPLNFTLKYKPA